MIFWEFHDYFTKKCSHTINHWIFIIQDLLFYQFKNPQQTFFMKILNFHFHHLLNLQNQIHLQKILKNFILIFFLILCFILYLIPLYLIFQKNFNVPLIIKLQFQTKIFFQNFNFRFIKHYRCSNYLNFMKFQDFFILLEYHQIDSHFIVQFMNLLFILIFQNFSIYWFQYH